MPDNILSTDISHNCLNDAFVKKKCRTCLSEIDNQPIPLNTSYLFSLEANEGIEFDIQSMLMCLTPIKFEDKSLPTEICSNCLKKLIDSFSFRLMCIKSDTDLRKSSEVEEVFSSDLNIANISEFSLNLSNDSTSKVFIDPKPKPYSIDEEMFLFDGDFPENILNLNESCETFFETSEKITDCVLKSNTFCDNTEFENHSLAIPENNKEIKTLTDTSASLTDIGCHDMNIANTKDLKIKDLNFICDYCGKQFPKRNGLLKKHIARHSNIKPYKCNHCDNAFRMKDDLTKHHLKHTSNNYVCHSCGATFSRKDSLKIHYNIHLGIKPYACPMCPKRFPSACNLKNHQRIHLNESPFVCSLCKRAFRQKSALIRHSKVHNKSHCKKQKVDRAAINKNTGSDVENLSQSDRELKTPLPKMVTTYIS